MADGQRHDRLVLVPLAFCVVRRYVTATRGAPIRTLPTWRPKLRRRSRPRDARVRPQARRRVAGARDWVGGFAHDALFGAGERAPLRDLARSARSWPSVTLTGVAATLAHFARFELWVFFPANGIVLRRGGRRALAWELAGGATEAVPARRKHDRLLRDRTASRPGRSRPLRSGEGTAASSDARQTGSLPLESEPVSSGGAATPAARERTERGRDRRRRREWHRRSARGAESEDNYEGSSSSAAGWRG